MPYYIGDLKWDPNLGNYPHRSTQRCGLPEGVSEFSARLGLYDGVVIDLFRFHGFLSMWGPGVKKDLTV